MVRLFFTEMLPLCIYQVGNDFLKGEAMFLSLLAGVGLSHLIVDGSIFKRLRGLLLEKYQHTHTWVLELISCYQCTGFWAGALVALFLQPIAWGFSWYWNVPLWLIITPLIFGFAVSYLSMVGAALLNYLDAPMAAISNKKQNESNKT